MSSEVPQDPFQELAGHITSSLGEAVTGHATVQGQFILNIKRDDLLTVLTFLRDDPKTRCEQLIDICGVDLPERAERFDVVYQLLSLAHNHRIRVKVTAGEETLDAIATAPVGSQDRPAQPVSITSVTVTEA